MMTTNYYKVINVKYSASTKEIKSAFRRLALQWHPDRHKRNMRKIAHRKFIKIMEAYEILGNPSRRKTYNLYLKRCLNPVHAPSTNSSKEKNDFKNFVDKVSKWQKKSEEHARRLARRSYNNFSNVLESIIVSSGKGIFKMLDSLSSMDSYRSEINSCMLEIKDDPRDVDAYYGLGFFYNRNKKYKEAAKFYKKAMSIDPYDADVYYNLGIVRKNMKDKKRAVKCFEKYISLKPYDAEGYYQLSLLKSKQGEKVEVAKHINRLKELHRKDLVSKLLMSLKMSKNMKDNKLHNLSILKSSAKKMEKEKLMDQTTKHALGERIKELNCLYGISLIVEKSQNNIEIIIQEIVNLIPSSWQYPTITCARITINEKTFKTKRFKTSSWKQVEDIKVDGNAIGSIEVYYKEKRMKADEGPFLKEERNLLFIIAERIGKIVKRTRAEEELSKRTYNLGERVKELNCLYGISSLVDENETSIEGICRGIVSLIPNSWQYPSITRARLTIGKQIFKTKKFKETIWRQAANIRLKGDICGVLEVFYIEEKPMIDEGPFLREERDLLDSIAERLGKIFERITAQNLLVESEQTLKNKNIALQEVISQIEIEKREVMDKVINNAENLLLPLIERLRAKKDSKKIADLLKNNLYELTSRFGKRISDKRLRLTPREIEICNMIKNGLSNKEISNLLSISCQTTEGYRKNIRTKLDLLNKKINLTTFLQNL